MKFLFKILAIVSLFFILIPHNKFSIYYGVTIIVMFIDQIQSLNFLSLEFTISFISLFGAALVFSKNKTYIIIGYILIILGLVVIITKNQNDFNLLFWFPFYGFILFMLLTLYYVFKDSRKIKNG